MAITVSSIQDDLNRYLGDSSTDRISASDRLNAITEAVVWLQEELKNDHQNVTYTIDFFDTIHYYKVTSTMADLLVGADLRRAEDDQTIPFTHKTARELAGEVNSGSVESAWGIERHDGDSYLVVAHASKYGHEQIAKFDSLTADGGTWVVDSVNSDATNLTVDTTEYEEGSGSINFDIDVSQSANNTAVVYNTSVTSKDLTRHENLTSFVFRVYIPDSTNMTSVTLYWGSDSSNYWFATTTTDIHGSAFVDGWNTVKVNWSDATKTSSPDVTDITYYKFTITYDGAQTDDTDFRLDDLKLIRPEPLTFHYLSWFVGKNSSGTDLSTFTATTDIPYFSGSYDQYRYAIAHKASSLLFYAPLRLFNEASAEEGRAIEALDRYNGLFPKSASKEMQSFKVFGINFNKRRR